MDAQSNSLMLAHCHVAFVESPMQKPQASSQRFDPSDAVVRMHDESTWILPWSAHSMESLKMWLLHDQSQQQAAAFFGRRRQRGAHEKSSSPLTKMAFVHQRSNCVKQCCSLLNKDSLMAHESWTTPMPWLRCSTSWSCACSDQILLANESE